MKGRIRQDVFHLTPPAFTSVNHFLSTAFPDWVIDTIDDLSTGLARIVSSGRSPLPPLHQSNTLSDHSIPNPVGVSQHLMVESNVGTLPYPRLAVSSPEVVPLQEIFFKVQPTLYIFVREILELEESFLSQSAAETVKDGSMKPPATLSAK